MGNPHLLDYLNDQMVGGTVTLSVRPHPGGMEREGKQDGVSSRQSDSIFAVSVFCSICMYGGMHLPLFK